MKVGLITVALLMVYVEISAEEISPTPSLIEHSSSPPQSENEMSPSPAMSSNDYDYPSSSQLTDASDGNKKASGGGGRNKTGIVVGVIAAASMLAFGGYVLKKRRENIRRSRYGYAATEFF